MVPTRSIPSERLHHARFPRHCISPPLPLTRRRVLQHLGMAAAAVPLTGGLSACSHTSPAASHTPPLITDFASARWATGGTRSIPAAVRAVQPFAAQTADRCRLTCEATIGPCHTTSVQRSDISDGWDGLPLYMVLRVVNAQCQPVKDAIVEIWHTNYTGGYSGQIVQMCNNNPADLDKQFFRGWQRTDAQGMVRFDSCYPGWYRGRAVHVHLRILPGNYDGDDRASTLATTQLLFPDALNQSIFASQPLYQSHGQPDTTLATDGVVGGETDFNPYVFEIRNVQGVMLASKTLTITSHPEDARCEAQGRMGMGGPPPGGVWPPQGMPPGGGFPPPPGAPRGPWRGPVPPVSR